MAILTDMLEVVHWLTRIKVVPRAADGMEVTETERNRGWDMQSRLKMPVLARAWQMLLKGLEEARFAPSTRQAAEMILIRLAFTSSLPTPDEALKRDDLEQSFKNSPIPPATLAPSFDPTVPKLMKRTRSSVDVEATVVESISDVTSGSGEKEAQEAPVNRSYESFIDIVVLAGTVGEFVLKAHLENEVHVITFEPGHIEFRPSKAAPPNLAEKLNNFLNEHTDLRWIVRVSGQDGSPTIMETRVEGQELLKAEAAKHPLVQSVINAFPGAKLTDVNPINNKPDAEER